MLAKILGTISILAGLLWFFRPEALKRRMTKKMTRKLRFFIYGFIIVFGFLVIASVIKAPGLLPKIVGILGIFVVIKGIMLLTSKTSEKMSEWLANVPTHFFRIWAVAILAMGVMLILT